MLETYSKYARLFSLMLISFIGFIGLLFLILFGFKWLFRLLDMASVTSSIYVFGMILVPAALFISVFLIFYKRTKKHPSAAARIVSNLIFASGILAWLSCFCWDMYTFFTTGNADTNYYHSFDKWMLIPSGASIFIVGIIQALAMPEEKDWVSRKS